jgi:hypothetical protein
MFNGVGQDRELVAFANRSDEMKAEATAALPEDENLRIVDGGQP